MNFLSQYSEIILCIITTILGYIVGRRHQLFMERRTCLRERFEKLYAPFEKMIWLHIHGAFYFSDLDPKLQRDFIELLFNNLEYADSELKELLLRFRWTYNDNDISDVNKHFFLIQNRISYIFNKLSKKLFFEPFCLRHTKKINKMFDKLP